MKKCSNKACSEINPQPLTCFVKNRCQPDGLDNWCKTCKRAYAKTPDYLAKKSAYGKRTEVRDRRRAFARTVEGRLREKKANLKQNYGLTLENYNEMFLSQNGCCGICKKHQSEFRNSLAVDHCHSTNHIRGLLCENCNQALGKFKDSLIFLENARIYLSNPKLKIVSNE